MNDFTGVHSGRSGRGAAMAGSSGAYQSRVLHDLGAPALATRFCCPAPSFCLSLPTGSQGPVAHAKSDLCNTAALVLIATIFDVEGIPGPRLMSI